jgi:hypothetical protein
MALAVVPRQAVGGVQDLAILSRTLVGSFTTSAMIAAINLIDTNIASPLLLRV